MQEAVEFNAGLRRGMCICIAGHAHPRMHVRVRAPMYVRSSVRMHVYTHECMCMLTQAVSTTADSKNGMGQFCGINPQRHGLAKYARAIVRAYAYVHT